MLQISLHANPKTVFEKYQDAISYLASSTIVSYNGQEVRPRGALFPTYDISQVCCWLSEQSLGNGMFLCTRNDGNSRIALIEPAEDEDPDGIMPVIRPPFNPDNLILISGDCYEGLKKSMDYFADNENQQLIRDPENPELFANEPRDPNLYIWPTESYPVSESGLTRITSQECFIYTKKIALTQFLVEKEMDDTGGDAILTVEGQDAPLEVGSEDFKEFLFVEANPSLPDKLFVKAQNTIRLFRLNSRYYEHLKDLGFHCLKYNITKSENEYDDLRLEGRMHAFNIARKCLNQLKTMQVLMADTEIVQAFIAQYRILMELTGYSSVWATVFAEGDDPGGFNDIIGVPAPTAPRIPRKSPPLKKKRNLVNLADWDQFYNLLQDGVQHFQKKKRMNEGEENMEVNEEQLEENQKRLIQSPDLFDNSQASVGVVPHIALDNHQFFFALTDKVFPDCPMQYQNEFKAEFSEFNTFTNNPQFITAQ